MFINYFYGNLKMNWHFCIDWRAYSAALQYSIATEEGAFQSAAEAFGFLFVVPFLKPRFADPFRDYNLFAIIENNFIRDDYFRWSLTN